jgi:carboxypeptidase family protein
VRLLCLALAIVCTRTLAAQTVRGQLVDSISRTPLHGAFLTLLDAEGLERGRAITDAAGQFVVQAPAPGAYRLRSKRIGFRPFVSAPLVLGTGETTTYNAAIDPIPVPLKEVVVAGEQQCDVEAGASMAVLWEEIREALAAVAWTSRGSGYWYELSLFEREVTTGGKRAGPDSVWHQVGYHQVPFRSAPALELMVNGYVVVEDDGWIYRAPDADVLLSDIFLRTHCFETKAAKGLVGLAFTPARGRDLPDVKGTLWVDPDNAELRYLEFTYTRIPEQLNAPRAGGRVEFMRVPNGAWIVRDWVIRMPVARVVSGAYTTAAPRVVGYREAGGSAVQIKNQRGTVVYSAEPTATAESAAALVAVPAVVPLPAPAPAAAPAPVSAAPAAAVPAAPAEGRKPMRDFQQLLLEEFAGSTATDAYGLVQEFRPNWLHSRGPSEVEVRVYVDGFLLGGLQSLHSIPKLEVERLRRLSGPEAVQRYGQGHSSGVIEVWTRRGE